MPQTQLAGQVSRHRLDPISLGGMVTTGQKGHPALARQMGLRLGDLAREKDIDASRDGGLQTAVLAGGCFWGIQAVYQHTKVGLGRGWQASQVDNALRKSWVSTRVGMEPMSKGRLSLSIFRTTRCEFAPTSSGKANESSGGRLKF